jgi:hypothetical protein
MWAAVTKFLFDGLWDRDPVSKEERASSIDEVESSGPKNSRINVRVFGSSIWTLTVSSTQDARVCSSVSIYRLQQGLPV